MPKRNRLAVAGIMFLMSLVTYACFLQEPGNMNVRSRMFLTLSLVGNADLSIDRYANVTIDKAESHGRFYSAKAPGLSLSNHLRRPTKYRVQGLLVFEISAWTTLSCGVVQCHSGRRDRSEPTTHI